MYSIVRSIIVVAFCVDEKRRNDLQALEKEGQGAELLYFQA